MNTAKKTKPSKENKFFLFVACSFDARLKLGAGGKLVLDAKESVTIKSRDLEVLPVVTKDFEEITGSCLELETMIWALETFSGPVPSTPLTVCTNFKATKDLLQKRPKLEQTNYEGTQPGTMVLHADLFKQFFELHDRLGFEMLCMDELLSETDQANLLPLFEQVCRQSEIALKSQLKEKNQIASKWF